MTQLELSRSELLEELNEAMIDSTVGFAPHFEEFLTYFGRVRHCRYIGNSPVLVRHPELGPLLCRFVKYNPMTTEAVGNVEVLYRSKITYSVDPSVVYLLRKKP